VAKIAHFPPEVISDAADRLRRYRRYYCIGRFSLGFEMYGMDLNPKKLLKHLGVLILVW
jgi:hypothetical protein